MTFDSIGKQLKLADVYPASQFVNSIAKTVGVSPNKLQMFDNDIPRVLEHLTFELGVLTLPLDVYSIHPIFEKIPIIGNFINAGMFGSNYYMSKRRNQLFDILDTDPDEHVMFIGMDPSFDSGKNVVVIANNSNLKRNCNMGEGAGGGIVLTAVHPNDKDMPRIRQLISLSMFKTNAND